jgi:hypothetical protein
MNIITIDLEKDKAEIRTNTGIVKVDKTNTGFNFLNNFGFESIDKSRISYEDYVLKLVETLLKDRLHEVK